MAHEAIERARRAGRELETGYGPDVDAYELLEDDAFRAAAEALAGSDLDGAALLRLARDQNQTLSCVALEAIALRRTPPSAFDAWAWRALRKTSSAQDVFVFRALREHGRPPMIGKALAALDLQVATEVVAAFVADRLEGGEAFDESVLDAIHADISEELEDMVASYGDLLGEGFRAPYEAWRGGTSEVVAGGGRLWARPFDAPPALLLGRRAQIADRVAEALSGTPRRSVVLVGAHGVGKTTLMRAAAARLEGLDVLEAAAAELQAGAVWVGELEQRMKELVERLRGRPVAWHVPNLEAAFFAGQHAQNRYGMLDFVLPAVESGELALLAEATPDAFERLLAERPQLATTFEVVHVRPLSAEEAIDVAVHALEHDGHDVDADLPTLRAAFDLAEQFLPRIESPGNLLRLVRSAAVEVAARGRSELTHSDLVAALAASSGLPLHVLDASSPLPLDDVRAYFQERILGQDEAIEAVVERIALIKAGLTDPTRPLGVFLFVGPTGTGKTEIAKALAEFLFGSADRLVRLDMSEFQTAESFDRLLADTSIDAHGAPLVAAIRRDPFAVVLLDEFDKSAAPVWDLFLQVFDDGRMTDQRGRVVDLRRSVIILTSNMGASIATRPGMGFEPAVAPFNPQRVDRELERSFRPEFINRLDRIVVFRPFERAQMRALLDNELARALTRRGLRERPWAVELDESAYEFLIDQGFSPALGARPLKRALERHLLVPLAAAIVEHRAPSGDQFLLVSAPGGARVEVTFVDPDASEPAEPTRDADVALAGELDLRSLALVPRSDATHTAFLLEELARIRAAVCSQAIAGRKEAGLAAIRSPEFWEGEDRHRVLAEIEYVDRLETAFETAARLGARLRQATSDAGAQLHGIVARRLYVLDRALIGLAREAPTDVFLRIRGIAGDAADGLPLLLVQMYESWAKRCGMRLERLADSEDEQLLAVSGLGCGEILLPEAGHHVLETSVSTGEGRRLERSTAVVDVVAWSAEHGASAGDVLAQARRAFAGSSSSPTVVRRYRLEPDPLVRDAVRGYRTGRADRVLAGDFDLF